ncbi:DUF4279 domain-containing protein [Trinickia dinghuensis]|uniref:DUF4279 domain-containing protein n=1 Tax=Trinickia dinghuensis TaxID=2291023 RepID=A0A3D8JVZ8_9BURK|nr:DUF4279 domain-containing protein [Trinickia dinghuensis]RDU96774.1 DUF4279 domain-containing protein [Trinickia dinghuensis]
MTGLGKLKPSSNSEGPRAYATFLISGDSVFPDFWTKYFGVDPDAVITKGKPFVTPSGRISAAPGRTGVWGVSSRATIHDDGLDAHLRFLISLLGLPREDLSVALRTAGATMRFFCYWENYSGTRTPHISIDITEIVTTQGGVIEIDEYPQRHRFKGNDGEEEVWV